MQRKHLDPSAVSYCPLSFLINAGGGNRRVNLRSYGRLCFLTKSFSIRWSGRFHNALCGHTGCESTDCSFGEFSGFPLRRSGMRFVSSCSLFRAVKGLGLQVAGEPTTPCDSCDGRGWLTCDFCEGQKVNVQAKNNRIYRRCPSCRTVGVVICPRCKVFKCVSFPDDKDAGIAL